MRQSTSCTHDIHHEIVDNLYSRNTSRDSRHVELTTHIMRQSTSCTHDTHHETVEFGGELFTDVSPDVAVVRPIDGLLLSDVFSRPGQLTGATAGSCWMYLDTVTYMMLSSHVADFISYVILRNSVSYGLLLVKHYTTELLWFIAFYASH